MSTRQRTLIFLPAAGGFTLLFLWGLLGLPPVGAYAGPYGDLINAVAVPERHVTDMVAAVNFDYRGFDTLGEEFILFASVMGVLLLMRRPDDEQQRPAQDYAPERRVPRSAAALRVVSLALSVALFIFAIYITTHGHLTPGGGFQGGALIVSGLLLFYLAGDFALFKRLASEQAAHLGEGLGAGAFALTGLAGLLFGGSFSANFLPLGQPGDALSGGTIWWLSIVTGLEVTSGLFLLFLVLLEDLLQQLARNEDGHD